MKYFHGFYLKEEEHFFQYYLEELGLYDVCGFSYGAIQALEFTKKQLHSYKRVDKLILLSPAFFETMPQKFKKLQLRSFEKNQEHYVKNFIHNCFAPYQEQKVQLKPQSTEELEKLLYFQWSKEDISFILKHGVTMEVYLGGEDKIIDALAAFDFFSQIVDTTLIKKANHFLLTN